jgi:ubiquinone/menaquinone biosynthesis C-methylase UbiE
MFSYFIQNKVWNTSGSGSFGTDIDEMYQHSIKIAKQYKDNLGPSLDGKVMLEIGTGFTRATMLYLIKEHNLSKVYCYDKFNVLHKNDEKIIDKYELREYLSRLVYISGDNIELTKNIERESVDYIVSNAVLEHVDDLELLFDNLIKVLKRGGEMYHKVDLRCHNKFKVHGELYFHTFSENVWNIMGRNIGHPNRTTVDQYVSLFDRMNLRYIFNTVSEFPNSELLKASSYLNRIDVDLLKTSIFEVSLFKL